MKKTKKTCCGRSMVEMLSVLAVIGILSIGGLVTYTLSTRHHRANEILNDVRMLGGNVMFRDKNYALNTEIEPEDFQKTIANDMKAYQRTNKLFGVVVSDVDAETCRLTLNKADGAYQMRVSQNGEGWSEWNGNTDICGDGTQAVAMEFLFNAQPAHDFAPGDDDSDDDDDPKTNTISCLNADESEACCLKDHPNYAYVNGKCVDKGCQECYSWNGSSCVFDEKAITAEHVNACLRCDVTGLVSISGRDESYAECYSCLNGTWKQNATNTQRCCEFWGMDWNASAEQCCPSGTKYAPKSKACCAEDSGFEIVEGECVEKCDGHRYALSEGGERVGWGCCPDSKWAANHFSQNEGKCCDSEEVVSNGHCCMEGFEWNGTECALPCNSCQKTVNGACVNKTVEEVDETCCTSLYGTTHEWFDGKCTQKCKTRNPPYTMTKGLLRSDGSIRTDNGRYCCRGTEYGSKMPATRTDYAISNGYCCQSHTASKECCEASFAPSKALGNRYRQWFEDSSVKNGGFCCLTANTNARCCAAMKGAGYTYYKHTYETSTTDEETGEVSTEETTAGACCQNENDSEYCCEVVKQGTYEWDGNTCKPKCPAERLIAETGECCAEGTKAINGVCCASDTDSETCCAGMHAAEGEYTLRTYSYYKFCVPKCGECKKFQYASPRTEKNAKACEADVSSETCCVKAGREWAAKESSGKQCCDGTVYNGLCYNKISGGLCRTGKSVPHCSEDLPRGTICQAASYNDSSRKREVSISTGGRGAGTRVFKCMQYTAKAECEAYGATLIDPDTAKAAYGCYNITSCKVTNYKYSCTQDHSNHYVLMGDGHMERENSGRTSCWWACNCEALCVKN